jgi:hypothetical protein
MSWFRGKPKNRRLVRMHVLDVKLRSDQVRKTRMRLVAAALGITFATILGFCLVWRAGEYALDRLIYQNRSFAVQEIDVRTDGVIAVEQLRRWAGVKAGQNLLALDLARVKRDLELVSMIKTVAVERVLPHTLRLRVTERDPLAQVRVQARANGAQIATLQIDADGWVMLPVDPRQRASPVTQTNDVLPVIQGVNMGEILPGRRVESPQARAALQLIVAFDRSPMSGVVDLQMIDVSSPQILVVTTGQGSQITFSAAQDLDGQLRRWRAIHDEAVRQGKAIYTLDLSVHSNPPVRLIEANAVPQTVPKTKTPLRKGKHNV